MRLLTAIAVLAALCALGAAGASATAWTPGDVDHLSISFLAPHGDMTEIFSGDWAGIDSAAWSPDGRYYAFDVSDVDVDESGVQPGLYVADLASGEPASYRGPVEGAVSWSSDSREVAVYAFGTVSVAAARGGAARSVKIPGVGRGDSSLTWATPSRLLVSGDDGSFTAVDAGDLACRRLRVTSGSRRRFDADGARFIGLSGGVLLAPDAASDGGDGSIAVGRIEGSTLRVRTIRLPGGWPAFSSAASPDGRRVALWQSLGDPSRDRLVLFDASRPKGVRLLPRVYVDHDLAGWSGDGRHLLLPADDGSPGPPVVVGVNGAARSYEPSERREFMSLDATGAHLIYSVQSALSSEDLATGRSTLLTDAAAPFGRIPDPGTFRVKADPSPAGDVMAIATTYKGPGGWSPGGGSDSGSAGRP